MLLCLFVRLFGTKNQKEEEEEEEECNLEEQYRAGMGSMKILFR
jgi:hypothetical protein